MKKTILLAVFFAFIFNPISSYSQKSDLWEKSTVGKQQVLKNKL